MNQPEDKKPRRSGILLTTMLSFNVIAAIILLIVQIIPRFSPKILWIFEPIAYSYPFLLIINIGFIIYWGLLRNRYAFISLFIIILGYDKLELFYRPSFLVFEEPVAKNSIKVMSYNVRLLDRKSVV